MTDQRETLSTVELAAVAEVSPQTIRRLCKSGAIPATRPGRDWVIQMDAARAWLAGYVPYGTLRGPRTPADPSSLNRPRGDRT